MEKKSRKLELAHELHRFENKWVALVDDKVVVAGESVEEVAEKAERLGLTAYSFYLVPPSSVILVPWMGMTFTFEYTPKISPHGELAYDPIVQMIFTNPASGSTVAVHSLIDSGAGGIILNAQFAKRLRLSLEAGTRRLFLGITQDPVVGYEHMLRMRLQEDIQHECMVPCYLLPGLRMPALLGQKGFFEQQPQN
jgi:hypothetical protein